VVIIAQHHINKDIIKLVRAKMVNNRGYNEKYWIKRS